MEKLKTAGTGNVLEFTAENFKAIIEFNQLETYIERLEYWKINQLDSNFGVVGRSDLYLPYESEGEEKFCRVMDIYPDKAEIIELKLFYNYKVQLINGYLINAFNETYYLKNTAHQRKDWIDFELQRIENKLNPEFIDNSRTEYFRIKCKSFIKGYNNERKGIGMVHRQYFDNENSIIEGAAYYRYKFYLLEIDIKKSSGKTLKLSNSTYTDLEPYIMELFKDKKYYLKTIEAFQHSYIIDVNINFIGNNKGVFRVWIEYCLSKSFINKLTKVRYAFILNKLITNLDLTPNFSEYSKSYYVDEKSLITTFTRFYVNER